MTRAARPKHSPAKTADALEPVEAESALVNAWWASILAGDSHVPHPVHGALKVHLSGGRLRLCGELDSDEDRGELVRQARECIGRGINRVDVSNLTVASHEDKRGVLEQTLFSAFLSREAAEFAQTFVLKHTRLAPVSHGIVDPSHTQNLRSLVPEEFLSDARKALDAGHSILVVTVDETAAFRVRELLGERTRSEWTIATPPRLVGGAQ